MGPQHLTAKLLPWMIHAGDAAADWLFGRDILQSPHRHQVPDDNLLMMWPVIEVNAGSPNGNYGADGSGVIREGCAAGPAEKDIGERLVLPRVGAIIDVQDDLPRRSWFIIDVSEAECDRPAR